MKSILSRLKATYNATCSRTPQMSCCLSKQHVQQIRVSANNTDSTLHEMVGLQNVDCLNCTRTVLFPLKKIKRMPVNARSLPEFNVHPSDSMFIIIIINPLTVRVVGVPQMILQPVFSIFPCSPLPSGTWGTPGLSIP